VADSWRKRAAIYFPRNVSITKKTGSQEGNMRKLSTIGLISAAAAFSFLCASATLGDGDSENAAPLAILAAH
jgi:hypothetical protein